MINDLCSIDESPIDRLETMIKESVTERESEFAMHDAIVAVIDERLKAFTIELSEYKELLKWQKFFFYIHTGRHPDE